MPETVVDCTSGVDSSEVAAPGVDKLPDERSVILYHESISPIIIACV